MNHAKVRSITLAMCACCGSSWTLIAQASDDGSSSGLDEIIVTAQKREQEAFHVPISLYALSGQDLEKAGISDLEGLSNVVAGLEIVGSTPGLSQISLRGITNLAGGIESTAAVGYYVDEVPVSSYSNEMPEMALWDLSRVEVLRGPQGTLFGEGSMAGTIRIITNKPDSTKFESRVDASVSSTQTGGINYGVRGLVNLPVIDDKLAVRLAASYKSDAGWNDVPDLGLRNVNTNEQTDARIAARLTATDALTVDASFVYHRLDTGDAFSTTSPGIFDPHEVNPLVGPVGKLAPVDTKFNTSNLTVNYDVGFATLVSASSYFTQNIDYTFDYDPYVQLLFGPGGVSGTLLQDERARAFTQELRLVSNGDNVFNWTVGGFYNNSRRHILQGFDFDVNDLLGPGTGLLQDRERSAEDAKDTAWAAFMQGEYKITPSFAATLGVRYYEDERSHTYVTLNNSVIFGETAGDLTSGAGGNTAVSPKFGLSWTPTDKIMTFIDISRGFRGGGTNANASLSTFSAPIPSDFKGEFMWSYEVGLKSRLSSLMSLNAYVYRNDWTDLQLVFLTPDGALAFTSNAGKAHSTGSELELALTPTPALNVRLNTSYVDAVIAATVTDPILGVLAQEGNKIPFSPKWKTSMSADYSTPLYAQYKAVLRGNYSYRSDSYSDAANTVALRNSAYGRLDFSIGAETDRRSVEIFVENATDKVATTFRNYAEQSANIVNYTYLRPRTVGLRLSSYF